MPILTNSPKNRTISLAAGLAMASLMGVAAGAAHAARIKVTVENLAPEGGLFLTPVASVFHNGTFDTFNSGAAASAGLEALAEDGNVAPLLGEATAADPNAVTGVILGPQGFGGAPVLDPGEVASGEFDVDGMMHRYFSFASMIIPSNDAFIANGNPTGIQIFDAGGNFVGDFEILVLGSMIWDAGTEQNTETDAAFLNQAGPDTGADENGVVHLHTGFIAFPGGNILGGVNAAGQPIDPVLADFTRQGFQVAKLSFSQVPEPASMALFGFGAAALAATRRRTIKA